MPFSSARDESQTTVFRTGGLSLAADVGPARWVTDQVHGFAENVGSLIPSGFASYARLLHPPFRQGPATSDLTRVTWSEVAQANERLIHPEVQFASLVGHSRLSGHEQLGLWDTEPDEGTLCADLAVQLAAVLGHYTATPERCWFAVWDGWGNLRFSHIDAQRFQLPGREYFLLSGPLGAVGQSLGTTLSEHRSANLWWPSDQAWCVASEVDLNSTYVGGSEACVAKLLTTPGLEVVPAKVTESITAKSDRVNPTPRLD